MTSKMLNFMKSASKWASSVCEEQWLPQTSSLWTIKYYENTSELYFLCGVFQNVFLKAVGVLFPWLYGLSSLLYILYEETRVDLPWSLFRSKIGLR